MNIAQRFEPSHSLMRSSLCGDVQARLSWIRGSAGALEVLIRMLVALSSLQPRGAEVEARSGEQVKQRGERAETDPNRDQREAE
jgi:hypothetical protein